MDSIYFRDPLGLLCELSSYRFEPPAGMTHVDVLIEAHKLRVARKDPNIAEVHLADAIETLTRERRESLSKTARRRTPTRRGARARRRASSAPGTRAGLIRIRPSFRSRPGNLAGVK